jgi:hypothetical protein
MVLPMLAGYHILRLSPKYQYVIFLKNNNKYTCIKKFQNFICQGEYGFQVQFCSFDNYEFIDVLILINYEYIQRLCIFKI